MSGPPSPMKRRLAASGVVLAIAMAVANAGNYGLNVVLARWLDPAAFGDLTLVVTLFLVLTAAAVAAQLLTAAQVARLDATGRWVESADLERWLGRRAGWTGVAAAAILVGTAPALADLFRMASWVPLVVFGLGLPFYLAQAVYRGAAQGRLRFGRLSASFLLEVAVRLVLSVALVAAGAGVTGAATGLSLSFVACWFHLRPERAVTPAAVVIPPTTRRAVFATAGPAMILLVGQIVVNNGDVLIVKSRFDAETAGTYAAVALVGRAVFFCTWAVVTTLFPAAARQDATGEPDPGLLRKAVAVTATVSATLTVAAWTVGPRVLELAFGAEYAGVGHLLGPYALATSLFALVNLLASHDLSLGQRRGPVVLAAGGAVQSVLVLLAGTTPDRVVWAQVLAMAGLLLATALLRRPAPAAASRIRQTTEMELTPAAAP